MRKLFVLFLLVSLVPFTVGCNGLWDFDDDDDPVPTTTLTSKAVLPSSAISAGSNIRAAVSYTGLQMKVDGVTLPATAAVDNGDGTTTVTFSATVPTTTANAVTGNVPVIIYLGNTAIVTTTVAVGTEVAPIITVTVVTNDNFATVTVTATSTSSTGTTTTVTTSGTTSTSPTIAAFSVTGVTFSGTSLTKANDTNTITVNTLTPTFRVNFSEAPANLTTATWEVTVKNETSGNSFTLTSTANSALFTKTAVGTAVDVKVVGDSSKSLKAGQVYSVTIKTNNLKNAAGTLLDGITGAYYFKTAATTFTTTTLTDYTGKAANITVATPQVITLTFSANVAAQPTGTVKLIRYADSARTTKEAELTIDATTATYAYGATNNIVTVTFNQPFVSGKFYTVQNLTGQWLDANGIAVEGVASINFATN